MNEKTISDRQLAANRLNAQKSTGPVTATGRAVSKMNALKHVALSRQLILRSRNFAESPAEFKALCGEFYTDLAPVGAVEEMLVQEIVASEWRLRRLRSAESASVSLNVDSACDQSPLAKLIGQQPIQQSDSECLRLAALIPSGKKLESILRYEAALQRQRDRAMQHLERLQRRRQGDPVPPPSSLQISA